MQSQRCVPPTELHCPGVGGIFCSFCGSCTLQSSSGITCSIRGCWGVESCSAEDKHTHSDLVRQHLTFTGMPIFCQLEALPAVALVGTINVGTLLAAGTVITFIYICIQKQMHRDGHSASAQFIPPFLPLKTSEWGRTNLSLFFLLPRQNAKKPEHVCCNWISFFHMPMETHMQTFVSDFIGFTSLKYVIVALKISWQSKKISIQFKTFLCKFGHYQVSILSKFEWFPDLTLFCYPFLSSVRKTESTWGKE